ncbi:uncharacterized protein [Parasteatoda tepidariorum]|uniref:uncharacterized protein n=1 Tax=Parasteatoda tepidariorum TaxID=114398 RepID=UPI001C728A45|nr:uncharacterized protein LOC122271552 [Parasteatoda tepidariorum]
MGSAVMKRWKNTKDNFVRRIREMKEASNMRSQNGVRFKKKPRKYVFHDQLQFLYKLYDPSEYKYHFKKEKRSLVEEDIMADVDNSIVMFEESKSENETIEDKDEYILGIDTVDDALLDDTPQSTQLVPIGNKRSYDEVQLKLLNALEKMENTNPHISFVNSLLPTLNKLTPEQILDFQYGVLKLLKDITSSKSSERPSTSTSYF